MKKRKGLLLGGILLLGIGFAAVSTTLYLNGDVNISANEKDFDVKFTKAVIDNEDRTSTVISGDGKTITYTTKELQVLNDKSVLDFEIANNSSLYDAEVSIECTSGEKGEYYQITKEVASAIPAKAIETGKVEVQKIKVTTEDIEEAFTCTLIANAKERTTKGKLIVNKNIVNKNLECLQNKAAGSCEAGTEIRYMVNDTTEKTFYVLHDDGETLTLQQRENTIDLVNWYSVAADNTKGPLTALEELDNITSDWGNVNNLSYEMGTTVFKDNAYTGCSSYNSCTSNKYTLDLINKKARMITVQEGALLGCTESLESCPKWLSNYLINSTSYGGTVNSGSSYGYWTMNAYSSNLDVAWHVSSDGSLHSTTGTLGRNSVRAVVEVNKYF